MINLKKTVAVSLAMVMLFSTAMLSTGCKKKPAGKAVKIEADTPWYNATVSTIGGDYGDDVDYHYEDVLGCYDDYLVVRSEGSYKTPDGAWEDPDFNYTDYQFMNLDFYTLDGTLEKSVNIQELVLSELRNSDSYYINNVSIGNDITITIGTWVETRNDFVEKTYVAVFDVESESFSSFEEQASNDRDLQDASNEGVVTCGEGYSFTKYWMSGDDFYSYILDIHSPDGSVTRLDLRDELPDYSIYDISGALTIDETHALIRPSLDGSMNDEEVYFIIDLENGTIEEDDSDYSWLSNESFYGTSYVDGVGNVTFNTSGIQKIDFASSDMTELFSFDMCNVNRSLLQGMSLYSYSEDTIVCAGSSWKSYTGYQYNSETVVIVLTKADSNPNVGKTLLTAASLDYISYAVCEAIVEFNNTNEEYFITISNKYSMNEYYNSIDYSDDLDWESLALEGQVQMSNQLAIDLIAGDGPDIIIGGMNYRQLNNSDYLLDLTDYFTASDAYFMNVIEAAKTGDALYQMPLAFSIQGIKTHESDVDDGQIGFTFEEYADFVDDVCNGKDPISLGQLDFFTTMIIGMNDIFEERGEVNYDCDAFREFAEFVKDNVNEEIEYNDEDYVYYEEAGEDFEASSSYVYSFSSFINWDYADDAAFLGFPSYDGRGPLITADQSVAISAETPSADACWQFIETLLSEDVQENFASDACPINVVATRTVAEVALEEHNASIRESLQWYSPEEAAMYGIREFDDDVIDRYFEIMSSASTLGSMDAAVQKILREEMPAYFSGQKSIDEVIDIIQDKVQTYINERG